MQAVILCGGRGERLMPLTAKTPASLLRILCKEVLLYNLEQLEKYGVDRVTLAAGYGAGQIKDFIELHSIGNMSVDISCCEDGETAKAVAYAADRNGEDFILMEGNCISEGNLERLMEYHKRKGAVCTAMVHSFENSENKVCAGIDESGRITGLIYEPDNEKCGCEKYLCGIYAVNTRIFREHCFSGEEDFVSDILRKIAGKNGELFAYYSDAFCGKIVTPEDFLNCQQVLLDRQNDKIISKTHSNFNGCTILPPVCIGKNVSIDSGVIIKGDTVIDDNAVIMTGTEIDGAYIGENSVIGQKCELNKSVICRGAELDRFVHCGEYSAAGENSVLGSESKILAGAAVWADTKTDEGCVISGRADGKRNKIPLFDDEGVFTFDGCGFSAEKAVRFGKSVGTAAGKDQCIVIGTGEGNLSEKLGLAVKLGCLSAGTDVCFVEKCTLGQLIFALNRTGAVFGIYAKGGAHCSLKILAAGGVPLYADRERAIEKAYLMGTFRKPSEEKLGREFDLSCEKYMYERYLLSILPDMLKGVNAEIRTCCRETAECADRIFHDRNDLNGEKIVFHISCGSSKCTAYSESSGNVTWEKLVNLCMEYAFENGRAAAVPYTFPSSADWLAEDKNGRLYRYYNSSADDSDREARKTAADINNFYAADGLMLAAEVCRILSEKKISLGKALEKIPDIYCSQRFISCKCGREELFNVLSGYKAGISEGVVMENAGARAVIRPLRKGGGLMIFAESMQSESAAALCDDITRKVRILESRKDNCNNL